MNVIVQGRQRRFIGGFLGDKPITEIWLGDKQIWPNMEGVARRIEVELPKRGSRDWQYWVHAVDATSSKSAPDNYMRFSYEGLDFYIQSSPDGTPPYRLNNNVLTLELYDGILIDQLGEYLEVDAKIAARDSLFYEYADEARCPFPFIKGTKAQVKWGKWKKKKAAGCTFSVKGSPSGVVHFSGACYTSAHERGVYTRLLPDNTHKWVNAVYSGDMVNDDVALTISTGRYSGYSDNPGVTMKWPSFTRRFKLKIISVS